MVSTRHHPDEFPEASPTNSPSKALAKATSSPKNPGSWAHAPSNIVIGWLFISCPLVIWDCGYVLLRPLTMPGGSLHYPLYTPYKLYGTIDYVYGFPAYNESDGFPSAQGALNVIETALYLYYMYIVGKYGKSGAKSAKSNFATWWVMEEKTVPGNMGALAVMVAFTSAVITSSKTLLYFLNEVFSGFKHIGHNDASTLVFLWIIPNFPWLILSTYMVYLYGIEILQGLSMAVKTTK